MTSVKGSSAPLPVPAMPPVLRELTIEVERLSALSPSPSDASTALTLGQSATEQQEQSTSTHTADGTVVPTTELLRHVDALLDQYRGLLELAQHPYSTQNATPAESSSSGGGGGIEAQAGNLMTQLEVTVGLLQRGIRSKQAQAIRLVLLNSLRGEVAERRQCVEKMEGVLSVSHQHVRM
ncbi:hypothetical protein JKF63_06972 [Porcisia hertigi]|uniref:Uncharacterized protein n=1 Tax=Porcisia hertigi TaxID=2761500 RepID=A0A836LFH2_9TRYP|nr:hypothetical protein JKF63_06972 [Porcisia hertigi]